VGHQTLQAWLPLLHFSRWARQKMGICSVQSSHVISLTYAISLNGAFDRLPRRFLEVVRWGDKSSFSVGRSKGDCGLVRQGQTQHIMLGVRGCCVLGRSGLVWSSTMGTATESCALMRFDDCRGAEKILHQPLSCRSRMMSSAQVDFEEAVSLCICSNGSAFSRRALARQNQRTLDASSG
jgi:hypothetical protein